MYEQRFEGKKIAVLDVDGTLSKGYFITKFPLVLLEKSLFNTEKLNNMRRAEEELRTGKSTYYNTGIKIQDAYAKGIKNQKQEDILEVGFEFVKQNPEFLFSYSKELIEILKNYNYVVILESGSPLDVILPFGKLLGADLIYATKYTIKKGIYTGKWKGTPTLSKRKQKTVQRFIELHNSDVENSIGFGDSYLDFPFIRELGNGVIFTPKPEVIKTIKENNWLICNKEDEVLNQVLELLKTI
ncbi:HAD-IB family phosphatase [Candidatus Micrarchaeota archaeon]|nr:HAD-IB family phosphatase [Candidatus Micrarchaeota archaeon]